MFNIDDEFEIHDRIPGFNNKYSVFLDGRVYIHYNDYNNEGKFLIPIDVNGYKRVSLKQVNEGIHKWYYVHRLVAMTYVSGYREGLEVNHIDFNKANNHFYNLEWVTRSENMLHNRNKGENNAL